MINLTSFKVFFYFFKSFNLTFEYFSLVITHPQRSFSCSQYFLELGSLVCQPFNDFLTFS